MLRPLKKRAMSWSEDCHGSPRALITMLSHTFSILLLWRRWRRGWGGLVFRSEKFKLILIKLHLPSAGFKLFTDPLLAGKCVAWDRKGYIVKRQNKHFPPLRDEE